MIETENTIAPDIRLRYQLTEAYTSFSTAYAKMNTELTLFGKIKQPTVEKYISAVNEAISLISQFLQKDRFQYIYQKLVDIQCYSLNDYILHRQHIFRCINEAYYKTGIIEIDQAVKMKTYDLDTELRQLLTELYGGDDK